MARLVGLATARTNALAAANARPRGSRLVFRATLVSTVLVGLGSISGMGRDLLIAAFFGADGSTDAFVVAWTLPETAIPLLIDVAMPLLLIPAFTRALAVAERSRDHDASAD